MYYWYVLYNLICKQNEKNIHKSCNYYSKCTQTKVDTVAYNILM